MKISRKFRTKVQQVGAEVLIWGVNKKICCRPKMAKQWAKQWARKWAKKCAKKCAKKPKT